MHTKKLILISILLISSLVFARYFGAFPCESCGNTTAARGWQSFEMLNNIFAANVLFAAVGDTARINGGDGSNALYQLTNRTLTIKWQCLLSCDVGDEIAGFIPPVGDSGGDSGGGSSGGGGGGGGCEGCGGGSGGGGGGGSGGSGGGGGTVCGEACSDGDCRTTCWTF